MIGEIFFLAWLIGMMPTFLVSTFLMARHLTLNKEAHAEFRMKKSRQHYGDTNTHYNFLTFWYYAGSWIAVLATTAASVYSLLFFVPYLAGRTHAIDTIKQREGQKEALKTLARFEKDPVAKEALERGDGQAYVDRYLDLGAPLGEVLDHVSMDIPTKVL